MNLTSEACIGALLSLGLLAIALAPAPQPSYAPVAAALAAQDALEVIEKDESLLQAAYGAASGEPTAISRLTAFAATARKATGVKCLSISSGIAAIPAGCTVTSRQVVLRRLLFDGDRFFFLEVRVGY